jgi:hypothetical protein
MKGISIAVNAVSLFQLFDCTVVFYDSENCNKIIPREDVITHYSATFVRRVCLISATSTEGNSAC